MGVYCWICGSAFKKLKSRRGVQGEGHQNEVIVWSREQGWIKSFESGTGASGGAKRTFINDECSQPRHPLSWPPTFS